VSLTTNIKLAEVSKQMNARVRAIVVVATWILSFNPAVAQEAAKGATPRPPIGPQSMDVGSMLPPNERINKDLETPPKDRARIRNIGNQSLYVSYWDGNSSWQTISIGAGQSYEIACAQCGETITIAFHNGTATKQMPLKSGYAYLLFWSSKLGAWDISSSVH
jgi:hypothetical protein